MARDNRAAASRASKSFFATMMKTSWLWLPLVAFMFRSGLTGGGGWLTAFLLMLWTPAFWILDASLAIVAHVRWREGAIVGGLSRFAICAWWFLAALPVMIPGDLTDQKSLGNPLLDWLLTWLPVAPRASYDEGLDIAIGAAIIAFLWWVVTMASVATSKPSTPTIAAVRRAARTGPWPPGQGSTGR